MFTNSNGTPFTSHCWCKVKVLDGQIYVGLMIGLDAHPTQRTLLSFADWPSATHAMEQWTMKGLAPIDIE
jgi:hypothetical protein